VLELRLTNAPIVQVRNHPGLLLAHSANCLTPLNVEMRRRGWTWVDQRGSSIYYRKGARQARVATQPMTGSFRIMAVDESGKW
jgi:hypothetical protein